MKLYILKDREVIPTDSLKDWYESLEKNKKVALTDSSKGWIVSTIFLGVDYSFFQTKKELFETMVFNSGTELDEEPFRYATIDEAEKGHEEIVEKVKNLIKTR